MRTVCAYSLWFPGRVAEDVWRELTASITGWYRAQEDEASLPTRWERGIEGRLAPRPRHSLECSVADVPETPGPLRELRWIYPDARDDTLLWTIDAATLADDGTTFSLILRIASADFELLPARFQLRTPRVIRQLVARGDAHIGVHRLAVAPTRIEPDGVPDLTTLLLEQSRRHPVIVISPDAYTDDVYCVDPEVVASTVAGLASVYVLASRWAGFALTDEIGKRLSCYNGAVRVYWPRFDSAADPFAHPLWLPPQIEEFGGSEGFARMLMRMIAGVASFRYVEPEPIRVYRARLEDARRGRLRAHAAHADYDQLFDEYVKMDADARALRERLDAALEDNAALRAQLAGTWRPSTDERAVQRTAGPDEGPELESVLAAVEQARRRTSHVIYLPEAIESARESPFRQADKVVSALLAIDDVAALWARQRVEGGKLGSRRDLFRQRGFEYKEDISQTAEGKWGAEYTYAYDGRRVVFAPHITIGAKSADRCLSIHMHWDEARRVAVIAHVGRHKTNTRS